MNSDLLLNMNIVKTQKKLNPNQINKSHLFDSSWKLKSKRRRRWRKNRWRWRTRWSYNFLKPLTPNSSTKIYFYPFIISPRIENSKLLLSPTNQNIKKKCYIQTLQTQGLLFIYLFIYLFFWEEEHKVFYILLIIMRK